MHSLAKSPLRYREQTGSRVRRWTAYLCLLGGMCLTALTAAPAANEATDPLLKHIGRRGEFPAAEFRFPPSRLPEPGYQSPFEVTRAEYDRELKQRGIHPLPPPDATNHTFNLTRLVNGQTYHLEALANWFQLPGRTERPLPAWHLIEGRVEVVLKQGVVLRLYRQNHRPMEETAFLRVSTNELNLAQATDLICFALVTGESVEVSGIRELGRLRVFNHGRYLPSAIPIGRHVVEPLDPPLPKILRVAQPPDFEQYYYAPTTPPANPVLERIMEYGATVDLKPLHEWINLRGIGPKPLADWFRIQGAVQKTTPGGFWMIQTVEDFRFRGAHIILQCPADNEEGIIKGGPVNTYARKTGRLAPMPGYDNLIPVYEYDGQSYPLEEQLTSSTEASNDLAAPGSESLPFQSAAQAEKIADLTRQLEALNHEYISLTNDLAVAISTAKSGPVGMRRSWLGSRGFGSSMADDVATSPLVIAARQALAANRLSYVNVKADLGRAMSDTPANRAAQADKLLQWQQQRAAQGSASAQYDLALRYLEGKGVTQDENEALRLLRASAAQGYTQAVDKLKELEALTPVIP